MQAHRSWSSPRRPPTRSDHPTHDPGAQDLAALDRPDGLAADRAGSAEAELANLRAQREEERDARIAELAAELEAERDARHDRERAEVAELKEALAEQRRREDRLMEALEATVQAAAPVARGLAEAPEGAPVSSGLLPRYVASGYRAVSDLLERAEERQAVSGEIEALRLRALAARRACEVLYQLVDDPEFYAELQALAELGEEHGDEINELIDDDERFADFRAKQLELLVIAGVLRPEAERLIDDCRASYMQADRQVVRQPAVTRRNLRRLRAATCGDAAGRLERDIRRAEVRAQVLPAVATGLGGAALVALGVPMEAIGGKVFAGVVGAIGSAGIQAGAQRLGKRR